MVKYSNGAHEGQAALKVTSMFYAGFHPYSIFPGYSAVIFGVTSG
jgi:hypothetical protein